jgi:hypothetical protein
MNKLGFALVGGAALLAAACGRNDSDTLNDTQDNVTAGELTNAATTAAEDANAEMEALGTQEQQQQAEEAATTEQNAAVQNDEDVTDPAKVEEDVQGM